MIDVIVNDQSCYYILVKTTLWVVLMINVIVNDQSCYYILIKTDFMNWFND